MALVVGVLASITIDQVQSIGVCNGKVGDNLPSRAEVVRLYKSLGIGAMRIYEPEPETLLALDGTEIDLIMDVGGAFAAIASDPAAAAGWIRDNVLAFPGVRIKYIAAGNEVEGSDTDSIVPAIKNLNAALAAASRTDVKVSTAVKMSVLGSSSPPSEGAFKDAFMTEVAKMLKATGAPLLANVYPYFAKRDTPDINLGFALFQQSPSTVSDSGLTYTNLFDAMVDALYSALEKAGAPEVPIVVSESGWPSAGDDLATVANAQAYNQGLIDHVGKGTPKRAVPLEAYIFAMFNENQKGGAVTEKNFGLFNGPDKTPVQAGTFAHKEDQQEQFTNGISYTLKQDIYRTSNSKEKLSIVGKPKDSMVPKNSDKAYKQAHCHSNTLNQVIKDPFLADKSAKQGDQEFRGFNNEPNREDLMLIEGGKRNKQLMNEQAEAGHQSYTTLMQQITLMSHLQSYDIYRASLPYCKEDCYHKQSEIYKIRQQMMMIFTFIGNQITRSTNNHCSGVKVSIPITYNRALA
uniref:Glucan endo-1,3-beta-glucosidase GII n=1 Tax=Aegilops tauschii TaxID=37682 RepID=N1QPA4_AEGTA